MPASRPDNRTMRIRVGAAALEVRAHGDVATRVHQWGNRHNADYGKAYRDHVQDARRGGQEGIPVAGDAEAIVVALPVRRRISAAAETTGQSAGRARIDGRSG
jgi:hypothetical protein